jgi:hypothetical protein
MAGSPSLKARRLYMRFWWVSFVDLGVMYANLVFAESLNPQLHNSNPRVVRGGRLSFFPAASDRLMSHLQPRLIAKTDQGRAFSPITPKRLQITYVVISPYLGLVTHIFIQFLTAQRVKSSSFSA